MSFLQPLVLAGLVLGLLPVAIHLLNRLRHRSVEWGAMRFLLAASKRTRGHARLRHLLIMLARMLAIAALVLGVARPLSSGWIGSLNASVDTAIVILDRSPSMAVQDVQSGRSSRSVAIQRVVQTLRAGGLPDQVVLIDSGSGKAQSIDSLDVLAELPDVGASDASADLPAMMQTAAEYLRNHEVGNAEIWVCSDGQRHDWSPESAQWVGLRRVFGERDQSLRIHVLKFRPKVEENLSVHVENLRRETREEGEVLWLDVVIRRHRRSPGGGSPESPGAALEPVELALVLNGARSVLPLKMQGDELRLRDHRILLPEGSERGGGRVELPEDENPRDNVYYFAYGPTPRPQCLIVSEQPLRDRALSWMAAPSAESAVEVRTLRPSELGAVDWSDPALVLWHAPLPVGSAKEDLTRFAESGGAVIFLPPEAEGGGDFLGRSWGEWRDYAEPSQVERWRNDDGILRDALDGRSLPVDQLLIRRCREIGGDGTPMAQLGDAQVLLSRLPTQRGAVYFLGTGVDPQCSNLVEQGVVAFVMVQRAIEEGVGRLSGVRTSEVGSAWAGPADEHWEQIEGWREGALSTQAQLVAGVYQVGDLIAVRNRPLIEDEAAFLTVDELSSLFEGLDHRVVEDDLDSDAALVQEIWRVFLAAMIAALLLEALLSLPRKVRS